MAQLLIVLQCILVAICCVGVSVVFVVGTGTLLEFKRSLRTTLDKLNEPAQVPSPVLSKTARKRTMPSIPLVKKHGVCPKCSCSITGDPTSQLVQGDKNIFVYKCGNCGETVNLEGDPQPTAT